jgi:aminoglycoside phosphotransferase (APT) family kinase protein
MGPLSAEVLGWAGGLMNSPVQDAQELIGGASRNSFILAHASGDKSFLRMDAGHGPLSGTEFTLLREYKVLEQLQGSGVGIARVYAFSAEHNAILMEFLPGYTSYQKTGSAAEEGQLRRALISAIVDLQRVDPRRLAVLGPHSGAALRVVIPADLAVWRGYYDARSTLREPLIDFALNWLERSLPDSDLPAVVVHGDIGPGNFLINEGRISALIDWEMTRLGHPLEDLACVIARALGAPFGEAREHIENFEALKGEAVAADKLDYALALVLTRWMIGMSMALSRPSALQNVPMLFVFFQINGLALLEALCRSYAVPTGEPAAALPVVERCGIVFRYAIPTLRNMASEVRTPAEAYKLAGVGDLLAFLRDFIAYGPERYEAEEIARIEALVGGRFADLKEANAVVCRYARQVAPVDARPLVEFLRWRGLRQQLIMQECLGARRDNRIRLS